MRGEVVSYVRMALERSWVRPPIGASRGRVLNMACGWKHADIAKLFDPSLWLYQSQDVNTESPQHRKPDRPIDYAFDLYDLGEYPTKTGLGNESLDCVLLLETIEHLERPWDVLRYIGDYVRKGGCIVVTAPVIWEEHRYPVDCYRFLPDGLRFLLKQANFHDIVDLRVEDAVKQSHGKPKGWQGIFATARKARE